MMGLLLLAASRVSAQEAPSAVPAPVEDAWRVLLDVPRIAPCMPGAVLTESDGDTFAGTVKVKLGPITLDYRGTGRFVDRDDAAHRVVIEASGRDTRSAGTAAATVTAVLRPDGDLTHADVTAELTITGRPAQFGRSMLADVGARLIGQFADCLATTLAGPSGAAGPAPEVVPIDLVRVTAGTPAFRRYARYALLVAGTVVGCLVVCRLRRRR